MDLKPHEISALIKERIKNYEDKIETEGKYSLGKKVVCVPAFHRGNLILRTSENELICLESKP